MKSVNVRDKQAMRQRVAATSAVGSANIRMETWRPEDNTAVIHYEWAGSLFGEILVGSTGKGVCYVGFTKNDRAAAVNDLQRRYPSHTIREGTSSFTTAVIRQMNDPRQPLPVHLHVKGTAYQWSIWKKLLQIPLGGLTTYAHLGGGPHAARAAGHAVGSNPIGFIIPCHRAIYTDGSFDRYFWGPELKEELLQWETDQSNF